MSLKLMYITNNPEIAKIAEAAGVERIFVDMEFIGKEARQSGMDTIKSHHTFEDIKRIADTVSSAEVLVRINPIHEKSENYCSTEEEIDKAIESGAKTVMLPYFKTVHEAQRFIKGVSGRARTMLLVETPEAAEIIEEIVSLEGLDEVFIGLNDLSLGYGKKFMFELLADGTIENLAKKIKKTDIPFGFGGIAAIGKGLLPAEHVITEHYRLGSSSAILSRSFCNTTGAKDLEEVRTVFIDGLKEIRNFEKTKASDSENYDKNKETIKRIIEEIKEKNK